MQRNSTSTQERKSRIRAEPYRTIVEGAAPAMLILSELERKPALTPREREFVASAVARIGKYTHQWNQELTRDFNQAGIEQGATLKQRVELFEQFFGHPPG